MKCQNLRYLNEKIKYLTLAQQWKNLKIQNIPVFVYIITKTLQHICMQEDIEQ